MSNRFFVIGSVAVVALMLLHFLFVLPYQKKQQMNAPSTMQQHLGGSFTLTNHRGELVNDIEARGKLMLVYFGFANCPAICPTDLNNISKMLVQLGEDAKQVAPYFISIDPARDTVESLNLFIQNYHPTIQALTGTEADILAVKEAYKVYAKRTEDPDIAGYLMDHSTFTYLMDRNGQYITLFDHFTDPNLMEEVVRKHL